MIRFALSSPRMAFRCLEIQNCFSNSVYMTQKGGLRSRLSLDKGLQLIQINPRGSIKRLPATLFDLSPTHQFAVIEMGTNYRE
jgi:hypothetical protein